MVDGVGMRIGLSPTLIPPGRKAEIKADILALETSSLELEKAVLED